MRAVAKSPSDAAAHAITSLTSRPGEPSTLVPAKITTAHLARAAYAYVRQSTATQVHDNLESQRRQYGLAEQARRWGWHTVEVIDEDLGRTGSGRAERPGFERLLAEFRERTRCFSMRDHATARVRWRVRFS